jgi:hypothetical protein
VDACYSAHAEVPAEAAFEAGDQSTRLDATRALSALCGQIEYAPGDDRVVLLFEESSGSLRRGQMWRLGKDVCFCFVPPGSLAGCAARIPLHVPSRKSMLQTHARFKCKIDIGNNRLQLYAPFSRCADSGFAVWEFRDLGSGVKVVGSTARVPVSSTPSIFSIAPPLARTLQTGSFGNGVGENLTIVVLSLEA